MSRHHPFYLVHQEFNIAPKLVECTACFNVQKPNKTKLVLSMRLTILFACLVFAWPIFATAQLLPGANAVTTPQQAPITLPDAVDINQIDSLIAPLTDRQARNLLKQSLQRQATSQQQSKASSEQMTGVVSFLDRLRNGSQAFTSNFSKIIDAVPTVGAVSSHALDLLTDLQRWPRLGLGVLNLIAMVLAGLAAGNLVHRLFAGLESNLSRYGADTIRQKISGLTLRAGLKLAELAAFFAVGQLVSLAYFTRYDPMRLFLLAWFSTLCVYLLSRILFRFLFSPSVAGLRLVQYSDLKAKLLFQSWVGVLTVTAFAIFNTAMLQLLGVPLPLLMGFQTLCGFIVLCIILSVLVKLQPQTSNTTTSQDAPDEIKQETIGKFISGNLEHRFSLLSIVGTSLLFLMWARGLISENTSGAIAAILVFAGISGAAYLRNIVKDAVPDMGQPVNHSAFSIRSLGSWLFVLIACAALLQTLDLDLYGLAQTPIGQEVTSVFGKVMLALIVSVIVWAILDALVQRYINREHAKAIAELGDHGVGDDGGTGIVVSRLGTLLPIFRGFALTFLVAITVMVVLSSMGINIGPLLAGAGVVGIAIGFGAQTLVKDIFSGIFFLIDDAFRIGEYVEFENYRGEVEKISIRSMRMRHHRGPLHTVPFGELRAITNHNRDWVIFKQDFELPYETDLEKVRKIIKKIGQELMEDPDHGQNMLAPLKSQGVKRVENGVLVIGTKFMCKPREQWLLRRIVYQRVRDKLYESGIQLAHRRVQIELPEDYKEPGEVDNEQPAQLDESHKSAVKAAAAQAIIEDQRQEAAKTK